MKFEIRSLEQLINMVIPFFDQFPLRSEKQEDFLRFKAICLLMGDRIHLKAKGLQKIVFLAKEMNSSGTRKYQFISEDIVSATSNGG